MPNASAFRHHSDAETRRAFETDRARDRGLIAAGWRVIRITWWQLTGEPEAIARDLRAALDRPARAAYVEAGGIRS